MELWNCSPGLTHYCPQAHADLVRSSFSKGKIYRTYDASVMRFTPLTTRPEPSHSNNWLTYVETFTRASGPPFFVQSEAPHRSLLGYGNNMSVTSAAYCPDLGSSLPALAFYICRTHGIVPGTRTPDCTGGSLWASGSPVTPSKFESATDV